MLDASELVALAVPSSSLTSLLAELAKLANERAIPLGAGVTPGDRQARLTVTADDASIPTQAQRRRL
jgi:hypothetical protein